MVNRLWSYEEEEVFWKARLPSRAYPLQDLQIIIPKSPKRIGVDRASDGLGWKECAADMKAIFGAGARRNYTHLSLFEHWFQNAVKQRFSPHAHTFVQAYLENCQPSDLNSKRHPLKKRNVGKKKAAARPKGLSGGEVGMLNARNNFVIFSDNTAGSNSSEFDDDSSTSVALRASQPLEALPDPGNHGDTGKAMRENGPKPHQSHPAGLSCGGICTDVSSLAVASRDNMTRGSEALEQGANREDTLFLLYLQGDGPECHASRSFVGRNGHARGRPLLTVARPVEWNAKPPVVSHRDIAY
ncbi:hypothetical protein GQ53DRAFT_809045 [Thozetella sp. PMI_491]|nr:hypothetical protein GQ53DRAFT_809045 [Thozetella sp. PMI_491]